MTYGYDAAGNLTTFTDAMGESTVFEYSSDGMLSKIYYPTDPVNAFVFNQYNASGKVVSQTDAAGNFYEYYFSGFRAEEKNPNGHSRIWKFDGSGRTIESVDALGNTTRTEYDALGRTKRIILPLINETQFEYDGMHNILVERKVPVPGSLLPPIEKKYTHEPVFNQVQTYEDPLGRMTDYTYDATGNLEKIEMPLVNGIRPEINYTYNSRGQIQTLTDPEGKITRNTYDATTGDLTEVTDDFGGQNILASFTYDDAGNRTSVTDPNGNTTTFSHNLNRELVSTISAAPDNHEIQYAYDAMGHLTQGRQQDNTLGNQWQAYTTTYSSTFKKASVVDPELDTILYQYDALDRLWKETDPENNTTEYIYDDAGRLVRKIDANTDPIETYTYTSNGSVASIEDGNQNTTLFTYDGLERLIKKEYPDTTAEEFEYDAAGNLKRKKTRAGEMITYSYDPLNRLKTKTTTETTVTYDYDNTGRLTTTADGTVALTYEYDTAARLWQVSRSDGKNIIKTYDDAGNVTQLTYPDGYFLTYTYDTRNRLEQILESGVTALVSYQYDSLTRRSGITYANGVATTMSHEPDNDITGIDYLFNSETVTFGYTSNKVGARTSFSSTDDRFLYQPPANQSQTYTTNNLNQYTAVNASSQTFDLNGNLESANAHAYSYDTENRLVQAVTPFATSTYDSDPMGRRQSKTVDAVKTDFLYDGGNIIAEYDGSGTMTKRFVYGPLIDEPICMITPQARYFYHADALGSIVAMSNDIGNIEEAYAYSPFGLINNTGALDNPYLFTGRRIDRESGLYYYRARHYSTQSGRFMQADPIGFEGGINLYAYALNDPINHVDPMGLWAGVDDAIFAGGGALVGVAGRFVGDLLTGNSSSWEDYAGSAVGGATGGITLLYTANPFIAGASAGLSGNLSTQGLKNLSGKQNEFDTGSMIFDTTFGAATGFIPGRPKIAGINAGRGSYLQIFRQITTKAAKGGLKNIQLSTAAKMVVGAFFEHAVGQGAAAGALGSNMFTHWTQDGVK